MARYVNKGGKVFDTSNDQFVDEAKSTRLIGDKTIDRFPKWQAPAAPKVETPVNVVDKNMAGQPKATTPPISALSTAQPSATQPTPTPTTTPTLLDTYNARPDVKADFEKRFPGQNPTVMGTEANRALNDWWSSVGQAEAMDMASKGQFDKPAGPITPIKPQPVTKTTRSLIDIANSRPDVLEAAKAQGGDPFKIGDPANTWLNNWWETAGKNEFPDVTLGPPTDEPTQFTDEANEFQEKLFDSLPKGDDEIDVRESKKLLDEIMDEDEDDEKLAPPPSMADLFKTTKATLGMEPLEEDLARIDSEIDIINSELLIQQGQLTSGQELVTSRQLSRRKGTLQKEADDRILRLNIEKGIVTRQLNNKINSLNMIMKFSQQDYTNSAAYYKSEFDKAVKIHDLVSGEEEVEMEIEEKAERDAKTNWTVVYNSIKDGAIDYKNLTTDQKLQIKDLETQAGLPIGFMDMVMGRDPAGKVQTVTSRTDSAGNEYYDILKVAPDGTMTVDSIFKGKAKVSTGVGYTPTSIKKLWLELGGEKGTGKTFNEFEESRRPDEGDTTESDRNYIKSDVDSITGSDGYVDPNKMKSLRQDIALNDPELLPWFDNAFQPKDMLNPEHYSYEIGENEWAI